MYLFLDAGDYLFKIHSETGTVSKKDVEDALVQLFNKLLEIPPKLLENVTQVIILNSSGYIIPLYGAHTFFKKILKRYLQNRNISRISLKDPLYHDLVEHLSHFKFFEIVSSRDIQETGFLFFDTLLTNSLRKFLIHGSRIIGYRKVIKSDEVSWKKISDVKRYLDIVGVLHRKFLTLNTISKNINEIDQSVRERFIEDLKHYKEYSNYNIHAVLFEKSNQTLFRYFLKDLENTFEGITRHYLASQGKNIPNVDYLILMDFDRLDDGEKREVLTYISDPRYENNLIILIIEEMIDIRDFPDINLHPEFSTRIINKKEK